ncbi:unnamed protein product [Peniophora sp. CBMAI 1063]|nr:unnamed protein product [Peniophora sp. CBMAI 1063]
MATANTPTQADVAQARLALRRAELDAAIEMRRLELEALEAQIVVTDVPTLAAHAAETPPDSDRASNAVAPPAQLTLTAQVVDGSTDAPSDISQGATNVGVVGNDVAQGAASEFEQREGSMGYREESASEAVDGAVPTDADEEATVAADIAPEPNEPGPAVIGSNDGMSASGARVTDETDVIEIHDEDSDAGPASSGMTDRQFCSRVARLAGLAAGVSGEWTIFANLMTTVSAFEAAHGYQDGSTRLPTGDVRSISVWQSRRRLAATLDPCKHVESNYIASVARLYLDIRALAFRDVSRMHRRYGLVGLAYGLLQAYSIRPTEGLEVLAVDLSNLLVAIRDRRLGREVDFDDEGTVEEALMAIDGPNAIAATRALEEYALESPKTRTPSPARSVKSTRKRDRDDEDGTDGSRMSGASLRPAKKAKVKAGSRSPAKTRSAKA